jgi:putative GTP pyrophosphokinase
MAYSKSRVNRAGQMLADFMRISLKDADIQYLDEVAQEIEIVDWWRTEHARPLSRVAANLRYYAGQHGKPVVAQRLKKLSTIGDKLQREPAMKLSRMEDIGGVRAVLPDQGAAYEVARRLRRNWSITRFRDYVANPKADGYRALHMINRNRGRLIEVQLRTPRQDVWANAVETYARTFAPGLKFGGGPQVFREYFRALGEIFATDAGGFLVDPALLARLEDLQEQVSTVTQRAFDEPR